MKLALLVKHKLQVCTGILCVPVLALMFFPGCSVTRILTTEQLSGEEMDQSVTLYLKDGRIIRFLIGNYHVSDSGNGTIQGKGKIILNELTGSYREFEGTIAFDEIEKVKVIETTFFFYAVMGAAMLGAILLGLLLWYGTGMKT